MFTITALIPDLFATGLSNHQIIVDRQAKLKPISCSIIGDTLSFKYKTSDLVSTVKDQWDTGIAVNALTNDLVLKIEIYVDGQLQAVTNNPPKVTLRKSGGGGNVRSTKVVSKGTLVGSFNSSKSKLILIRYHR